jgi:hypothetical protein
LSLLPDGRLPHRLKRRWRDGTTHVIYEPLELMERLAALAHPPRFNIARFYLPITWPWPPYTDENRSSRNDARGACFGGKECEKSLLLAEIADKAKPKLLILYHQWLWGATKEQLLEEIGRGYSGKVVFGNDLDVY